MKVSVCCSAFPFPRENLLRGEHSQPESIPILVDWLGDPAGQYSTETHVVADDLEVALRRGEFMRNHRSSVTFHAGMGARTQRWTTTLHPSLFYAPSSASSHSRVFAK